MSGTNGHTFKVTPTVKKRQRSLFDDCTDTNQKRRRVDEEDKPAKVPSHPFLNAELLSNGILLDMTNAFTPQDLCVLSRVCREFYLLFSLDILWRDYCTSINPEPFVKTKSNIPAKAIYKEWFSGCKGKCEISVKIACLDNKDADSVSAVDLKVF